MRQITYKEIIWILIIVLLWNPVMILLLSKSILAAIVIPLLIIVLTLYLMSSKSHVLKVVVFNVGLLLSLLCHAELIFRVVFSQYDIANLYEVKDKYYFNKPLLKETFFDKDFTSVYITNRDGYRIGSVFDQDKTVDTCSFLFIGDSFTQGAQVNYDEMFSTLIGDSLKKTVINGGISGAGIFDEYYFFINQGYNLKPSVVFLELGVFNDFFDVEIHHPSKFTNYLMDISLYRYFKYNIHKEKLPLGRWTEPFFATKEDNANSNILYKEMTNTKHRDIQNLKRGLIAFKKAVDTCHGKLIIILIPSKEQISNKLLKEVQKAYAIKDNELDMSYPNRLMKQISKEIDVPLIDLYSSFKSSQKFPFFTHDEHMNKVGHRIVAQEIIKYLATDK